MRTTEAAQSQFERSFTLAGFGVLEVIIEMDIN